MRTALQWSAYVATVTEVPFMALLPNFMVQSRVLKPFRYQTAGTVLVSAFYLLLLTSWELK